MRTLFAGIILLACLGLRQLPAGEYFVGVQGSDAQDGLSRDKAFLTVQKGVDALQPGDTLTILPGEYFGSVRRDGLGDSNTVTTIRAALPGTVVLRGDVPLQGFQKAASMRFAYVADLDGVKPAVVVNEADTLRILKRAQNLRELDFMLGIMFHDTEAGKLYVTPSDGHAPEGRRYTATLVDTHGIYLSKAQRVVIEGLAVTGFNALKNDPIHLNLNATWGMFIADGSSCVIKDCKAWLNSHGIGIGSRAKTSGGNVIERCTAWANTSDFGVGDRGGLTLNEPRKDCIRDSLAFLNGGHGINIRRGSWKTLEDGEKSVLLNNIAWGNAPYDFRVKAGSPDLCEVVRCVGENWTVSGSGLAEWSIVGRGMPVVAQSDTIVLRDEARLSVEAEFADPAHHDYRLQATSRFRNAGPEGKDRGPYPYTPDIFYVRPDGDDNADGLSVSNAWKTPAHALRLLEPGNTLYLLPGVYEGDLALERPSAAGASAPVSIRGRGFGPVTLRGAFTLRNVRADFQRLAFEGPVDLRSESAPKTNSDGVQLPSGVHPRPLVSFSNCRFAAAPTCVQATGIEGLAFTHCAFSGFSGAAIAMTGCTEADLRSNRFENDSGIAVQADRKDSILYAGYNGYQDPNRVWSLPDGATPHHLFAAPLAAPCAGAFGRPFGPSPVETRADRPLKLVAEPRVHSLSGTTANIEWMTSLPATCELVWGDTPECVNTNQYDVNYFGTFSLTGLEPGRTYYFAIRALRTPVIVRDEMEFQEIKLAMAPLAFTTPTEKPKPCTYYVAPDGMDTNSGLARSHAWKTLQHAADSVNPGDTVLIAGGTYCERVRIRATGETGAPISFKAIPGEQVVMDGMERTLNAFFIATGKKHLRFDGLRLRASNQESSSTVTWFFWKSGEITLYDCEDVEVTRCFSDGRGGYSANFISALRVSDLRIRNCVHMNKFSSMAFTSCAHLLVENCAFIRPMIASFLVRNSADQPVLLQNNIFTDSLKVKADGNVEFLMGERPPSSLRMINNCFMIRDGRTPQERHFFHSHNFTQLEKTILEPVFDDAKFAGDPAPEAGGFSPDRLMSPNLEVNFHSFFATNPKLIKRGIGLQPQAFTDFHIGGIKED